MASVLHRSARTTPLAAQPGFLARPMARRPLLLVTENGRAAPHASCTSPGARRTLQARQTTYCWVDTLGRSAKWAWMAIEL